MKSNYIVNMWLCAVHISGAMTRQLLAIPPRFSGAGGARSSEE